jgi:prolyl-tRNA synthetase
MDTIMPSGRVLQTVGAHYLGQKFAKSFKIEFLNQKNKKEQVHMACYGVSTRLTAAALSIHGDDQGLVIPPKLARWQAVIIPIIMKKKDTRTVDKSHEVKEILKKAGIRVNVDDSNKKSGDKYYYWEMKGVPLRIEIGPNDLEKDVVTVVHRHNKNKKTLSAASETLAGLVQEELDIIEGEMKKTALDFHAEHVKTCMTVEEMQNALETGNVARIPFHSMGEDGKETDKKVHELTGGEVRGHMVGEAAPEEGVKCIITGEPAKFWGYAARCY